MDKKTLIMIVAGVLTGSLLGLGGLWYFLSGDSASDKKHEAAVAKREAGKAEKATAGMTSAVELYQLNMPCRRNVQGNTPVVHADFQLLVPLKYRLKAEQGTSRIRGIIASILINSEIDDVNKDSLVNFKKQLIAQIKEQLDIEVEEVLVIHYAYDVIKQKR